MFLCIKNKQVFLFSRKKKLLKDFISNGYIDIHSHLLPNIDDGSKSITETIDLIKSLENLGFKSAIATPHIYKAVWDNSRSGIENKYQNTLPNVTQNCNLSLQVAAEYMLDENFEKLLSAGNLLTLKNEYVLVEMSYLSPPIMLFDLLFELQLEGYKPVLAHPERYNFYHNHFEYYNKLKTAGCLFQMNLLSSTGYYGKHVAECADRLLKENLIDFVGSDVHHQNHIASFENKVLLKNSNSIPALVANNLFFEK